KMAIRVSKSGGWISVINPHSKREIKRFSKVGMSFGRRDHTTIIHSYNKIKNKIKMDKSFKNIIDNLTLNIKKS
ncbi:unnamed protein product, partial [marine sediment metagenome]